MPFPNAYIPWVSSIAPFHISLHVILKIVLQNLSALSSLHNKYFEKQGAIPSIIHFFIIENSLSNLQLSLEETL